VGAASAFAELYAGVTTIHGDALPPVPDGGEV
jgi:hypothetical protein